MEQQLRLRQAAAKSLRRIIITQIEYKHEVRQQDNSRQIDMLKDNDEVYLVHSELMHIL